MPEIRSEGRGTETFAKLRSLLRKRENCKDSYFLSNSWSPLAWERIRISGGRFSRFWGTEWKQYGKMRYADCRGSFKCINGQCPFCVQIGVTNTKQFKIGSSGQEACSICGDAGQFVICSARSYVKYSKKNVRCFIVGATLAP